VADHSPPAWGASPPRQRRRQASGSPALARLRRTWHRRRGALRTPLPPFRRTRAGPPARSGGPAAST